MNKPVIVVFDLGKVLVNFDYSIAIGKLSRQCKMAPEQLADFLSHSPLLPRYETGLLTSHSFYRQVSTATGFDGSFEEFGAYFGDIFSPIEPMIQLHADLRTLQVPTFLFSNTNEMAIHHMRKFFPFFGGFDGYILSYEHHSMKPEARLYEVVESKSDRRATEILYLDDRPENVAAGAARGWQALVHESPEKTLAHIRLLGLLDHQGITKQ